MAIVVRVSGRAIFMLVRLERQSHGEAAPLARGGLDVDGAAMFADDSVADREAEAGALADCFGGEEGIEDSLADLGLDSAAGVGDFDSNAHRLGLGPGPNRHAAFRRACVD